MTLRQPLAALLAVGLLATDAAAAQKAAEKFPTKPFQRIYAPQVIRYADDLVVLHDDLETIKECQALLTDWPWSVVLP